MRNFFLTFLALFLFGCKSVKEIPLRTDTIVKTEYRETVRFDTVLVDLPKEYAEKWVYPKDTLKLAISVASATAWVDSTTNTLQGILKSLETPLKTIVPTKDKIVYRDSIIYKEKPVKVEVVKTVHPKYEKWLWMWLILSVGGFLIWLKNKRRGN